LPRRKENEPGRPSSTTDGHKWTLMNFLPPRNAKNAKRLLPFLRRSTRILQKPRHPSRPTPILHGGRQIIVMAGNVPIWLVAGMGSAGVSPAVRRVSRRTSGSAADHGNSPAVRVIGWRDADRGDAVGGTRDGRAPISKPQPLAAAVARHPRPTSHSNAVARCVVSASCVTGRAQREVGAAEHRSPTDLGDPPAFIAFIACARREDLV